MGNIYFDGFDSFAYAKYYVPYLNSPKNFIVKKIMEKQPNISKSVAGVCLNSLFSKQNGGKVPKSLNDEDWTTFNIAVSIAMEYRGVK